MGKINIDRGTNKFEGVPPGTALYFTVLEQSGCIDFIRSCCRQHERESRAEGKTIPFRKLDVAMAFKAYTGTMFTNGQRYPLYETRNFYNSSPTDVLFGASVQPRTLSDTNIAGRMEDFMELDTDMIVEGISSKVNGFFGLESNDRIFDSTDVDFFGVDHADRTGKAARMKYSSKCKSGRKRALHKEVMCVCDGNGVLTYAKVFDGATSDTTMDMTALDRVVSGLEPGRHLLSGDCKFCDVRMIQHINEKGLHYISKVPDNFSEHIRRTVVDSALSGSIDESETHPGRAYYETHSDIVDSDGKNHGRARLIAFRLPNGIKRAERYLRDRGLRNIQKALKNVWHKRFRTREEVVDAVLDALDQADQPIYNAEVEYTIDKRAKPGEPSWMVRIGRVVMDEDLIRWAAERHSLQVIITNVPLSTRPKRKASDPSEGMTSDEVIQRYLGQAHIEKRFRMMKTCHGLSHVFIHTPVRQDSMVIMDALATCVQTAMDAALKAARPEDGRRITVEMLDDKLVGCRIGFDREGMRLFFSGDDYSRDLFFEAVDRMHLDLGHLFPYA